ncbi:hypothetical protein WA026_019800 [Henosepilachna vigintioctopunctata]|uniref:Uncharacterized protein n=1 Tax=Henosepilachna vigintioctopunctata TaxID=420089 RepID=A0AAW1V9G0_9CUCU
MHSLKTLVCFFLIGAIYAEKELSEEEKKDVEMLIECGKKWDISEEEIKNIEQLTKDPTEKILCFLKCISEKDGTLDEAGNVQIKNIDKIVAMMKLENDDEKSIKECMRKVSQKELDLLDRKILPKKGYFDFVLLNYKNKVKQPVKDSPDKSKSSSKPPISTTI